MTIISPGDKFDLWTVEYEQVKRVYPGGQKQRQFLVRCICGWTSNVEYGHLVYGHSHGCRSCMHKIATVALDGTLRFLGEVLRESGVTRDCYDQRRHRGMSRVEAATKPMQSRPCHRK